MYIRVSPTSAEEAEAVHYQQCPYRHVKSDICSASLSRMHIMLSTRLQYCETEDFSNCPLVLAKLLRGGNRHVS